MIEGLQAFQNVFKIPELKRRVLITLGLLAAYRLGAHVPTPGVDGAALVAARLIKASGRHAVKILGDGDVSHALTVKTHKISESARRKLEAAGGRIEVLPS